MTSKRVALYPGSFDPITMGHIDLITRGTRIFDEVIVAVTKNIRKKSLFSAQERVEMIEESLNEARLEAPIRVATFDGLLVDYARAQQANVILRGLRAVADFEFESQMAHMNRRLEPGIEVVFLMTGKEHFFVSSSLIREVAKFGGSVSGLVPRCVEGRLQARLNTMA